MEEVPVEVPAREPVDFGQHVVLDPGTHERFRANIETTRDHVELRLRQYAPHSLGVFPNLHRDAIHRALEGHEPHSSTYVPGEGVEVIVETQARCAAPVAQPVEHQPQVEPSGYIRLSQGIHHAVRTAMPTSLHHGSPHCGKSA